MRGPCLARLELDVGQAELFGSAKVLEHSARELEKMLRARGIYFGDGLLPTYPFALVAPRAKIDRWARQAETAISDAEHLARRLIEEPSFYSAMGLSPEAFELISIDPGYKRSCVICRPDGIPIGDDIKFVELNCDSPAMMMFLDIVAQCLLELDVFAGLRGKVQAPSSADQLLDALLACYREHGGTDHPTIAITDWEGQKTRFEHKRLAEHFEARGYPTVICDPRAFRSAGRKLELDGRRIHIVYRRALASEVIERRHEIVPLIEAYRDGTICMVNPLRSYVASAKAVLSQHASLPSELRSTGQSIPRTLLLVDNETRAAVLDEPTRWALKKSESHGGMNVVLPTPGNEAAWRDAIEASSNAVWIAQEYLDVPRLMLPTANGDAVEWTERFYNWNPFVFGGRYAGGLVRVSSTPLINITLGGGLLPTLTT